MANHDAIIVGARCAGSPAAMLLARKGYRVLVVDRAKFPSDALSTHVIQPRGVAVLKRWGLLDRVIATGCPPMHTYVFDFGPVTISGTPGNHDSPVAYCPRRILLDKILVDAASEAGAEVREEFSVDEVLFDNGRVVGIKGHGKNGSTVTEHARVVIGADGRHSLVARAVRPEQYREIPPLQGGYYTYFSNFPVGGKFEIHIRPNCGFGIAPTNDGLTMIVVGWAIADYEWKKNDYAANYRKTLESIPDVAERLHRAKQEDRFYGGATANFFRKPYGAGWALIGDAGCEKDPITAQGITDAFLSAERCAQALHEAFSGARSFEAAMSDYQRARDERILPMYEITTQLAAMQPPPPEMQQLLGAMHGNREAMDQFAQMNAGTLSPRDFFDPQNLGALMAVQQR
jgi:flavin-dependent dehydrogenase